MHILSIGNSFSVDATTYLHDMAKRSGKSIIAANLFIGGCPLERHFRNMLSAERAYELQYNGEMTGFRFSLKEAILARSWDIITIQQASHFSAYPDTYTPYIERLAEYIRTMCPKAKLVIHQTWAYEAESERLSTVAHFESDTAMFRALENAYATAADNIKADGLIPSGEVMYKLSKAGVGPVHRDTFHAAFGIGRYALAMTWLRYLTGADITENDYLPEAHPLTKEEIDAVKSIVSEITPMA